MKLVPTSIFVSLFGLFFLIQCGIKDTKDAQNGTELNGGLFLPDGFQATVVIDSIKGRAREIIVNDNGDIYVKLSYPDDEGGCAVLRDTDGDGRADIVTKFAVYEKTDLGGYQTAMRIHNGYLYFSTSLEVYRYKLTPGKMVPESPLELVLKDDHEHGNHEHIGKPISFDKNGDLYVPFGAPSNSCQDPKRPPGVPGMDPCPQLEDHGGVWKFKGDQIGLTQEDGEKYASGIRSVVAMDWNNEDDNLYLVMHGRDDLLRLFPKVFSPWQSALLPSEEFLKVEQGSNFGWPYCFYDQLQEKKVLAPEYGGDGNTIGRCADFDDPIIGFPGHWAPNGLHFYQGEQFPERYKYGAFVAFHGSTNRAPYPQSGYFVAFIPFTNGSPSGDLEVFADGFAKVDTIINVSDAVYRPMGIAAGPDGSLYLSETEDGKIWKVQYTGDRDDFNTNQLLAMEEHKKLPHIKTPDIIADNLRKDSGLVGENLYYNYCGICHQS
ncbi:MAG: PQQ-dependent sugar dehydrogenase, partial [Bacteroidetes bacterium]|nr:PQQ-dependent sugar dehydrogenase [Bacteroidota bacterium]